MVRRAKYGDDDMQLDEHLAVNIAKKRKCVTRACGAAG